MGRYLMDCEVMEMDVRIPRSHVQRLLDYFDGEHDEERGAARAVLQGGELRFEARGGRFTLALEGEAYAAREIEIFDDRTGEFFEQVVVNLFIAYQGVLRCHLQWAHPRVGSGQEEVEVKNGRCNLHASGLRFGGWLAQERFENPGTSEPEARDRREILAKLEEAERLFAEYLRLKSQRDSVKG